MIFSKWFVEVFDGKYTRYGGHWQFLSRWTGLDYLTFGFMKYFFFGHWHEWYDGQHHVISLGWFRISWGGKPFTDSTGGTMYDT